MLSTCKSSGTYLSKDIYSDGSVILIKQGELEAARLDKMTTTVET